MLNVALAVSPIVAVLIGVIGLKKSAMKVAPIVMIYTVILGWLFFNGSASGMLQSFHKGVGDGIRIVYLIFAAFSMLVMTIETGAMDKMKEVIADITDDRRIQVLIIAVMFGIFLEGVAGAGAPAAVAAPFLVGLGFNPISAATAALIANGIPGSWGGAGVTTIMGSQAVREYMSIMEASSMTGRIHMLGAFIMPFLVTLTIFGKKGMKNLGGFLVFAGSFMAATLFVFSNIIGPEVTSMCTGLLAIIATLVYLKIFKIKTPSEFLYKPEKTNKSNMPAHKAFAPYLILMILLPAVRYSFDLSVLARYGYTVWVGTVIFISAFLGALVLGVKIPEFAGHAKNAFKKVIPALVAMCGLLVLSDVMVSTGMMSLLAKTLSNAAGKGYPFVAVAIGALGSFMTGTGLGSNIMFATMHVEAATSLGLNPITVFAGQNVGGAIGNMICINNVVAVATTVGVLGKEGQLMKKVLPAFLLILVLYGLAALMYTHYLFPNFGVLV
ncbi:L-lactate permease [Clostridium formicaceticum]|uniref:L-lactate permease n=1 Tax=Clostridium formicaceticum TaxID=1497 RepID=A0AAC9RP78_9CLOT|nr:L-lactate permease [Clostridium formicaceticum]AOY78100.1 hypothetical protein BJL90_20895 [Clostridium formicaceticum]ARE88750.1 L-lactate permease [Clostridium formicaceticum]